MALTTNLISYYKLDGNSNDSVGSINGTDTSATYSNTYGIINNGVNFPNNSTGGITMSSVWSLTGAMTVSCWVKLSEKTNNQRFVSTWDNTNGWILQSDISLGWTFWVKTTGSILNTNSTTNWTTGVWHHVVGVYDGSTLTLYLDGSVIGTPTSQTGNISTGSTAYLGCAALGIQTMDNAGLDEVGIWSRALTSTEVTELYNSGTGKQYPFVSFLPKSTRRLVGAVNRASFY